MSHIDTPHIPEQEYIAEPSSADALVSAKQDKLDMMSAISDPELQKLAQAELSELEDVEAELNGEKQFALQAHAEFKSDIDALKLLQDKF